METKIDLKSIVLKNGCLLGGGIVAGALLVYVTDLSYSGSLLATFIPFLINTTLSIFFIAAALEEYKKANEGFLTYGEGMKVGMLVVVIAAVIYALYMVLYATVIDPNYFEKGVEVTVKKLEEMGTMTGEQLEQFEQNMLANKPSVVFNFFYSLIGGIIGGLVVSLIVAAVKKKERPSGF